MALDINEGYKLAQEKISSTQKYARVKNDIDSLKKRSGSSLETVKTETTSQLSQIKEKSDKFQSNLKEKKTQFDELLDLSKLLSTNSSSGDSKTIKYLKKIFVTAITELKPKIGDILNDLGTSAIGCSQDQSYVGNQTFYLRVKSFDLTNFLKEDPDSNVGKITYEKNDIQYGLYPFSFNRELYNRMQNINQPYSIPATLNYLGTSGQELFDITYVESYVDPVVGPIQGNFYKIDLKPRINNNKVVEFLKDYYSTIEVFDFKNIFANLINQLTGAISIKKGEGDINLDDLNKVLLILQRILGLCFDSTTEIDVSGNAKVSQNGNIDKSFFEFTEIDLRTIDQKISDVKLGVVEFLECDTVKLPVDTDSIIESVSNLNFIDGANNNNVINDATNITKTITDGFFPLKIDIDASFLKEFPKAIVMSILSPKVVLPIMIMAKSLGQTFVDEINSFMDFAKKLSTYFINLVSKISALFVKIIFNIVKKDIKALISRIISDVTKEKTKKYTDMILSLVSIITSIANLIKDFRECNSIIDDLIKLLGQIQSATQQLPLPLLLASKLRKGFSKTSAFLNVISEFEKLGLPTGPMPDGSPNLMLASVKSIIDGIDQEITQNARVDIGIGPLSVTPAFITIPNTASGLLM
jgi:hypothetical protein